MKKQAGFTLIELVIVIVILGILAATALPKFMNLQDDARLSAAQGVKAAVQGATQVVYSKSAIEGEEKTPDTATPAPSIDSGNGIEVNTNYGYPSDTTVSAALNLDGWEVLDASGFTNSDTAKGAADFVIVPTSGNKDTYCYVSYTKPASANDSFAVEIHGEGTAGSGAAVDFCKEQ